MIEMFKIGYNCHDPKVTKKYFILNNRDTRTNDSKSFFGAVSANSAFRCCFSIAILVVITIATIVVLIFFWFFFQNGGFLRFSEVRLLSSNF